MGNKNSGSNYPKSSGNRNQQDNNSQYNTPEYYRRNRELGQNRYPTKEDSGGESSYSFPEGENDNLNTQYDELNTGKYENYNADGYYGSNYGSIGYLNNGPDYEQNAGYRDRYNRLTTGQWPEIESAERSRNKNRDQSASHKGKGPRSYSRSDTRIHEDINDALYEDRYVDASDIEVVVENGEVTLLGQVDDRQAKRRAEDIAESVSGVKHLENRLRVRRPGGEIVNIQNSNK
ncbi:BON domain-containing protein [Chryseosolibacter indicus]|uniref:BON domain-containing protein n=1 Tax=Chryseosolibacter indicus TaxID=2782351 RepID=A0ABS5VPQ7_9BACT|nr:BON domain-containing protein [Chryseosolibacter indicus]MBT1703425.1 BON domain-containing protein [Chryseosolibacter indicus]